MLKEILNYQLLDYHSLKISVSTLLIIVVIFVLTKLFLFLAKKALIRFKHKEELDEGRIDALMQIIRYLVWIVFTISSLQIVGIQITWLLASGAALLVGIGLGLQNIFNDIISGVIILFEGSIDKGDIISIGDDMLGEVKKINIRTTIILTRKNISVIVPNHKLIDDNIVNWSHHKRNPRFELTVGVAYGTPTRKVKEILLKIANENNNVDIIPEPFVRFKDFGDSSLNFELYFWSNQILNIEDVMSEMRFCIDDEFIENGVQIPFPQRDIHIKSK